LKIFFHIETFAVLSILVKIWSNSSWRL